jgi:hypothetical protein
MVPFISDRVPGYDLSQSIELKKLDPQACVKRVQKSVQKAVQELIPHKDVRKVYASGLPDISEEYFSVVRESASKIRLRKVENRPERNDFFVVKTQNAHIQLIPQANVVLYHCKIAGVDLVAANNENDSIAAMVLEKANEALEPAFDDQFGIPLDAMILTTSEEEF